MNMLALARRKYHLTICGLLSLLCFSGPLLSAEERPPTFIIVFVDDLGYSDIGPFGATKHRTPVLDQMAKEGMMFTDFYAQSSCTPGRAAMQTGRNPNRSGMTTVAFQGQGGGLPAAEWTLASVLKQADYNTYFMGKWHLSGRYKPGDEGRGDLRFAPENHGFDINIGGCCYGGPPSYFSPY